MKTVKLVLVVLVVHFTYFVVSADETVRSNNPKKKPITIEKVVKDSITIGKSIGFTEKDYETKSKNLVKIDLEISKKPIKCEKKMIIKIQDPYGDMNFLNMKGTASSTVFCEDGFIKPAEDHVFIVGHIVIDAKSDFDINFEGDIGLYGKDKGDLFVFEGDNNNTPTKEYYPNRLDPQWGWIGPNSMPSDSIPSEAPYRFKKGSGPEKIEVFWEVPESDLKSPSIVFFSSFYSLKYTRESQPK
ncbi:MAG: hypothetical protein SWQ30_06835 [Thermodesulfobacteriota bacterium]|nr:hypothetical protein [Thermodesulfobacteriota bacterium]